MRQVDIKLLWGRAASRCSICRCELTQSTQSSSLIIGEHAHIVGETPDSPRGMSTMLPEERDRYHNLILLCPNDHTLIDKAEADYPVERLHQIKTDHELWVQDSLGSGTPSLVDQAAELEYALLVDAAVESCRLPQWNIWTSWALAPTPRWPADLPANAESLLHRVMGAVLTGRFPDLDRALQTLARALHAAAQHFLLHSSLSPDKESYIAERFYTAVPGWDQQRHQELVNAYDNWVAECHRLIVLATKAANWFADEVRRSINPFFFVKEGKFLITSGPYEGLRYTTALVEFSSEEKVEMPKRLIQTISENKLEGNPPE